MTSNKQRKAAARALAAAEGINYTEARRRITTREINDTALAVTGFEITHEQGYGGHEFEYKSEHDLFGCVWCGGYEIPLRNPDTGVIKPCPKNAVGLTPPPGWPTGSHIPAMVSTWICTWNSEAITRTVQVRHGQTQELIAETTIPFRPAVELIAEYEAAGLIDGPPGSPVHTSVTRTVGLGRPDLIAHQLGYDAGPSQSEWTQWPDGSWRTTAWPMTSRHIATLEPLRPGLSELSALTIREYPGGRVVVDELIDPIDPKDEQARARLLDQHGYTVKRYSWERLPGGVRYATAMPGHLAERYWRRLARLRITVETKCAAPDDYHGRTYKVGEILKANQNGRAGEPVDRDSWWVGEGVDIDGGHILPAANVEVVEVLHDVPPTWADAALPAGEVLALLGPYFPEAGEAVAAWYAAGLVVTRTPSGLAIYTPGPEYRWVGGLARDYWDGHAGALNRYTKGYEAVDPQQGWLNRHLKQLPLDPVAAAAPSAD